MAGDNPAIEKTKSAEYAAVLGGVIVLANLFSNCIEAFGLIHHGPRWEKDEQLLLCRLGLQQARLLIWGDAVGITSPPSSVTDRAIPKHPSAAYPDLNEPTFFGHRDERLDKTDVRTTIEAALSALVDRSSSSTREEMMHQYGLKPPKRFANDYQPALDVNRLECFRERYELLKEVAETYAQISSRRSSSITHSTWTIADRSKFEGFIKLTQEKVDELIGLMGVKDSVDRGMRMDIKALGWHLSADRQRIAQDVSKLRLLKVSCMAEYPEYVGATDVALNNIERERKENLMDYSPYASTMATPTPAADSQSEQPTARRGSIPLIHSAGMNGQTSTNTSPSQASNGASPAKHEKRPGVFGKLFGRGKAHEAGRSQSVSAASNRTSDADDPPRARSDSGLDFSASADPTEEPARSKSVGASLETGGAPEIRSKSVGEILNTQPDTMTEEEQILQNKLETLNTNATVPDESSEQMDPISSAISRHDQYHGLARQGTHAQSD